MYNAYTQWIIWKKLTVYGYINFYYILPFISFNCIDIVANRCHLRFRVSTLYSYHYRNWELSMQHIFCTVFTCFGLSFLRFKSNLWQLNYFLQSKAACHNPQSRRGSIKRGHKAFGNWTTSDLLKVKAASSSDSYEYSSIFFLQ